MRVLMMQRGQIVLGWAGRMVATWLSGQRGQGEGQGNGRQYFRKDRHFREIFLDYGPGKSGVVKGFVLFKKTDEMLTADRVGIHLVSRTALHDGLAVELGLLRRGLA